MSTRIEKQFIFQAGIYYEDRFMMNIYDFSISMLVQTDSVREQNIAMERIKYFVNECLESSIFVNKEKTDIIKQYQDCGFKIAVLPEDPYDQVIGLLLMLKLNAIAEGRLKITDIVFGSKHSDEVSFCLVLEQAEIAFPESGWWTESHNCITKNLKANKNEKVVKLFDYLSWESLGLTWKEKKKKSSEKVLTLETDR